MAGMRAVHKKNGTTFKYSGDLKETIEKAEKELKEKEGTTQWLFLKWQYDNARKAFGLCIYNHNKTRPDTCTSH